MARKLVRSPFRGSRREYWRPIKVSIRAEVRLKSLKDVEGKVENLWNAEGGIENHRAAKAGIKKFYGG